MKLVLTASAELDIEAAYNWYEEQQTGLGDRFLHELARYYKKIEHLPTAFTQLGLHYRQAALKKFPYVIIYELFPQRIVVHAVFHTRRNPDQKPK